MPRKWGEGEPRGLPLPTTCWPCAVRVFVAGTSVFVAGTSFFVAGTSVFVAGTSVFVAGTSVSIAVQEGTYNTKKRFKLSPGQDY